MKAGLFVYLVVLLAGAVAQAPTPKKDPFAEFGNTGLDKRKPVRTAPGPFQRPVIPQPPRNMATPAPVAPTQPDSPAAPVSASGGIALAKEWTGKVTQASGGQEMKMKDLLALLSPYGQPQQDLAPHPEVTIYEGARMNGSLGQTCRIAYLMPLSQAEAQLFQNRGLSTGSKAVAPGFPDGLFLRTYDVQAGIYNRLCLVVDGAKPEPQVVALQLKAEGTNYYPASPPFVKRVQDWHVFDYVNARNRGQGGIVVDTRVLDRRNQGGYIIVNTTGGYWPAITGPVNRRPLETPKETNTWYVPEPLIKLCLFSLREAMQPQ